MSRTLWEKAMKKILGLDLGTNSAGWALINIDSLKNAGNFIGTDVSIFQETIDKDKKIPKNQTRRSCRGQRRTYKRRKMRKSNLINILQANGLLPESYQEVNELLRSNDPGLNPFYLRYKGLSEKLELFEFGRILFHINQRRGFLSNRKSGKAKDDSEILNEITEIQQLIDKGNFKTLGDYLYHQPVKRGVHTSRKMYADEIEALWEKQSSYYPEILKPSLMYDFKKAIIEQRPLKIQKHLIGKCPFEKNRPRAAKALLESQEFRIWQNINNLTVTCPKTDETRGLSEQERLKVFKKLNTQKSVKFGSLKTTLGLIKSAEFNLESDIRIELKGNSTNKSFMTALSAKTWNSLSIEQKNQLVVDYLTIDRPESLKKRLKNYWDFDPETIEKIFKIQLPSGYFHLSRKAIMKLLPFLRQGYKYHEACEKAGYNHSEIEYNSSETEQILRDLRNPVVAKAVRQALKLTRSIIRQYGVIDEIVIEMPREMKKTKKQKESEAKIQAKNKIKREHAVDMLSEKYGNQQPTKTQITKYLLWEECGKVCPYTGETISESQLFSQDVDIEHIIPWSISMDNSYMNKTLCFANENRNVKKNMTPFQAYHNTPAKWEQIKQRIKRLPKNKRKNFLIKEIEQDEFTNRQLNDTGYICRTVKKYFEACGFKTRISKGRMTDCLRSKWKLNYLLNTENRKNRKDHRHHSIDALVIACTTQGMLQKLSRQSASWEKGFSIYSRDIYIPMPWEGFYQEAKEAVSKIIVSHKPTRGIIGSLHDATAYGYHGDKTKDKAYYAHKVPVSDLLTNAAKIEKICDPEVKKLVKDYVFKVKSYSKEDKEIEPLLHKDGKTLIKSVRVKEVKTTNSLLSFKNNKGKEYKFYSFKNNHHVELIKRPNGKFVGKWVTMHEAANRTRRKKTNAVQFDHPEGEFIMWLCANDMVEIDENGEKMIFRVQKLDPNNNRIYFRLHTAATLENKSEALVKTINQLSSLKFRKLFVDILGNIQDYKDGKNN